VSDNKSVFNWTFLSVQGLLPLPALQKLTEEIKEEICLRHRLGVHVEADEEGEEDQHLPEGDQQPKL
jgi:hypothetical protein